MSAVTFLRSTDWHPSALPAFGGGGYEMDTCRVPWRGRATTKLAFVNGLVKFQPLAAFEGDFPGDGSAFSGYPYMFFDSVNDDQAAVFPTVELNYRGFKLGAAGLPPPQAVDSRTVKIITLDGAESELFQALSFQGNYLAPRTVWTWYQAARPDPTTPQYTTVRANYSLGSTMYNLRTPAGAPVSLAVALQYVAPLKTQDIVSEYTVTDVVPNAIWLCTSTVDREFAR